MMTPAGNPDALIEYGIAMKKQYDIPFYATQQMAESTITPFDHFPYKFAFRGVYNDPTPRVLDREAGFRPRHDNCYKYVPKFTPMKQSYCWQAPCTTILPCLTDGRTAADLVNVNGIGSGR